MDEWVNQRLDQWVQAKRMKDFPNADRIRDELRAEGIEPDKARPAPMPGSHGMPGHGMPDHGMGGQQGGQQGGNRPDFSEFRGGGHGGGAPMGRLGGGGFPGQPFAGPAAPFAAQNDPQFLEHLDQLMHRQNQMEAQLIQMQAQLQATNDIMDQQQRLLASAGLTPLGRAAAAAPGRAPAAPTALPSALPSEPITRNGQSVSLAPPPSNDALLSSLGAPPVMPPLGLPPLGGAGGIGGLPGCGVLTGPMDPMDGGPMGGALGACGPIGGAALLPPGPPPAELPGAPPAPLPGGPPPGACGKRGVDAAGL